MARKFGFRRGFGTLLTVALLVLTACGGNQSQAPTNTTQTAPAAPVENTKAEAVKVGSGDQERFGGHLKIAYSGHPATLDITWTTNSLVRAVAWHLYENLFTYGAKYEIVPMLATGHQVSADGLTWTFPLRKGVKFHNGAEMKSADVKASLERWMKLAGNGKQVAKTVSALETPDDYTVKMVLNSPNSQLLRYLAEPIQAAAVMPADTVKAAGDKQVKDYIGTGPYKFVEWKQDQYIRLERFQDYAALEGQPNGYGGRKVAYADRIDYLSVPDSTIRLSGVETGEYHFAEQISQDAYDLIAKSKTVKPVIIKPDRTVVIIFNNLKGPFTNVKLRQAAAAALNVEPILMAGYKNTAFFRADPSMMPKETIWWTESGAKSYSQNNLERAKQLLKDAGYKGEPIKWMIPTNPKNYYDFALAAKQQMEAAGFVFKTIELDYAAVTKNRKDASFYDMWNTAFTFRSDPTQLLALQCNWPGKELGFCHAELDSLMKQLAAETEPQKRMPIWEKIHALYWEQVPSIKIGDSFLLSAQSVKLQGVQPTPERFFWNTWVQK